MPATRGLIGKATGMYEPIAEMANQRMHREFSARASGSTGD